MAAIGAISPNGYFAAMVKPRTSADSDLYLLDTATPEAGRLYQREGWSVCGTIPDYALMPDGTPDPDFTKQVQQRAQGAGLLLTLGGAVVLMADSLSISTRTLAGDGMAIITSLFYAGYLLVLSRSRAHFSTPAVMFWTTSAAALCVLPVVFVLGEPQGRVDKPLLPEARAYAEKSFTAQRSLLECCNDLMARIPPPLPTILDGKRNDIGNTAAKYAEACFDELGAEGH